MTHLSHLAATYPASGIRAMFERAEKYDDVLKFTFGEPDFDTPDFIKEAAKAALDDNDTKYVSNLGLPDLREAIASRYAGRWDRPVGHDNVLVTVGAMEALLLSIISVVDPGQDVLVPDPAYPNYLGQIQSVGANVVSVPVHEEHRFKLQAADVAARITENTAAILINSPSNPLGSMIDAVQLREIVSLADRHGITVISDEVYEEIVFDDRTHTSVGQVGDGVERHIVINSFSKSFAMTGWRCGWLIAPADIVARMAHLKEGITSCVPPFVQRAGLAALNGSDDITSTMRGAFQERRDVVVAAVAGIPSLSLAAPEGAFYAFINVSATGLTSEEFAIGLLEAERVCVVPGTAFGSLGEGYVRLSFASDVKQIRLGFERISHFVKSI